MHVRSSAATERVMELLYTIQPVASAPPTCLNVTHHNLPRDKQMLLCDVSSCGLCKVFIVAKDPRKAELKGKQARAAADKGFLFRL